MSYIIGKQATHIGTNAQHFAESAKYEENSGTFIERISKQFKNYLQILSNIPYASKSPILAADEMLAIRDMI